MLKKILAAFVMLYAAFAMAAVDVNKASEADLDNVKGIGPVTSKLIMAERKKGPFKNWEDFISRVKGIGESRAAKLSEDGLTVNGTAFKAAAASKDDKKETKKETKAGADNKAADSKPAAAKTAAADSKPAAAKTSAAEAKPAAAATPAKPAASAASAAKK